MSRVVRSWLAVLGPLGFCQAFRRALSGGRQGREGGVEAGRGRRGGAVPAEEVPDASTPVPNSSPISAVRNSVWFGRLHCLAAHDSAGLWPRGPGASLHW